jgi:DNA-binding response OmpR family regulator
MTEANRQGQAREIRILMVPANLFAEEDSKQTFFSRKIFSIQRAGTAKGAVEIARKYPPHLIIFSNKIKDMSAEKFCRTIRTELGNQQIRLLMLTDMLMDSASSADGEADAHLVNPVDDQQLFKTVAELLNIRVRSAARVAVDFITQVELFPKGDVDDLRFIANVLNVSETGMRVESPIELPVGAIGRLRFFLPGATDSLFLYCLVRVLADEVSLHYGLEFIGNTAREKQLLKQFVENHSEGNSTV